MACRNEIKSAGLGGGKCFWFDWVVSGWVGSGQENTHVYTTLVHLCLPCEQNRAI